MIQQWNGIQRAISDCWLETCYSLYTDPDDLTSSYLRVNGLSIYADEADSIAALLPMTVEIVIDETSYTYHIDGTSILRGAYSPSGGWMANYVILTSATQMAIPSTGTTFSIGVTVTAADDTTLSFTETGHRPLSNSMTTPERMYTGRVYEFQLANAVPAGSTYRTIASLTWFPKAVGYYTTQIYEEGFYDATTNLRDATQNFSSFYMAVANRDGLPGSEAASLMTDALITFRTYYLSDSFTDGCVILEMTDGVPVAPRDEVDAALTPVITGISVEVSPAEAEINSMYVHRQAALTFTPTIQFQYGDTLSYLNTDIAGNRYAPSVTVQATGVTPGTEYVRPDTGETETAGDTSVRGVSMQATGTKWKLTSAAYNQYYTVLFYHYPHFDQFAVHRMSVSETTTEYLYNGTYYKKDDFGDYCMIEYTVSFSDLDGENDTEMTIQYGTHRIPVTPGADGSGFLIVSAPVQQTLDVIGILYDNFSPYGIIFRQRLSTGMILMDFLSGGKGVAFGKVASEQNAVDISNAWDLLFYKATVGAYDGTTRQDLVAWMHDVDARLEALES